MYACPQLVTKSNATVSSAAAEQVCRVHHVIESSIFVHPVSYPLVDWITSRYWSGYLSSKTKRMSARRRS